MHQQTAFFTGPAEIAIRQSQVAIFPAMKKTKRGHYEVKFHLLIDDTSKVSAEELVSIYAARLEEEIVENPSIWLWTHRRWKLEVAQFPGEDL